jgi:crotonobetainyl-CoA:carnitine CoA-transferase CaiB-like acyl-CoA transferase
MEMALEGLRVLDLSQDRALYVGKLLADLGTDVIKVEPPQGDRARRIGPFKDDVPNLETSLYFASFNTNKRGITLNLNSLAGQNIFKQMVARAEVVIEDLGPGVMQSLGLGYPVLRELNPAVVMTSVTGFGQEGPYSNYKAPDIVSFAMGGAMFICGDPERPPVVAPAEQAYHSTSLVACFGTLAALYHQLSVGKGQLVEISAQEVVAALEEQPILRYSLNAEIMERHGSQHATAPTRIYPCKDGYVYLATITVSQWKTLLDMMENPEIVTDDIWNDITFRRVNVDILDPIVKEFTMKYNKAELTEQLQARHLPCTPVNLPEEFVNDPHIKEREFITEVEHPAIGRHRYFRAPYILSETPCRVRRPAPLLGQDNEEIYHRELGYSNEELVNFKTDGVI